MEMHAYDFALICRQQWLLKHHSILTEDNRNDETGEHKNQKGWRGEPHSLHLVNQNETAVPLVGMWIVNVMFVYEAIS